MRSSLTVTLAVAVLVSSTAALAQPASRPTYVLVHGGFHGGWAWQRVADKLRESNARVYTPTLTGLGERAHLVGPEVSLSMHVQDIVSLLEFEDLRDVVLVGHSYAGMVITGVAAAVPERIGKLVYFDAAVPEPGQTFFEAIAYPTDHLPPDMVMMPPFSPQEFGITDPADIAYVGARLRPQPMATFEEPLAFSMAALAHIPKVFIHCKGEWLGKALFLKFRDRALAWGWEYYELEAGHDAMVSAVTETHTVLRRIRP